VAAKYRDIFFVNLHPAAFHQYLITGINAPSNILWAAGSSCRSTAVGCSICTTIFYTLTPSLHTIAAPQLRPPHTHHHHTHPPPLTPSPPCCFTTLRTAHTPPTRHHHVLTPYYTNTPYTYIQHATRYNHNPPTPTRKCRDSGMERRRNRPVPQNGGVMLWATFENLPQQVS
jgi:hypothetical protein